MDGYILDLRNKYQHMTPKKPQYSPHKHHPIDYGATQQLVQPTDTTPLLNEKGIKRIQGIVGALLYVGMAVYKKLLLALSAKGAQQGTATEDTAAEIEQLLDYMATYPNDGILFRISDMILEAHAYAGFPNESSARSRLGPHVFLSENEYKQTLNGPVLTIAQIIKTVTASAAGAELAALYITTKNDNTNAPYTH